MTPERLVLDTDIVIELLRKRSPIPSTFMRLAEASTQFLLSPLVVAEVYAGAFEREYAQIEGLFDLCTRLTLDGETGRLAGQYAMRYRKAFRTISLEDYLLAATARQFRCPLWTGNRKHYPMDDIDLFEAE
jgi:predicted nucleic acid-binding protein